MKHLKTKLGLSVLALACLGAGVISLQPSFDAKAEETGSVEYVTDASGLVMTNGASVRVAKGWSGIRWETTVKAGTYADAQFGTLVAPTKGLGEDGILTHDDDSALDLVADKFTADAEKDTKFYSAINYDNLAKEEGIDLAQAYALELTARAYVKIDGEYHYADLTGINTSRSARQVAIAAELDGTLVGNQASACKYYGYKENYNPTVKSIGAAGTPVINLETIKTNYQNIKNIPLDLKGETVEEILVGAERVQGINKYDDSAKTLAFQVLAGQIMPTGEHYITVFTTGGTIYTTPVIGATKVITTTADLKMFNAKGDNDKYTTKASEDGVNFVEKYWKAEQEQSGYYVLGNNIDASTITENEESVAYVHGSKNTDGSWNNSTWNQPSTYKGKPIGLTGTFNGMGYSIKNLMIATEREGFFGIVNGGTVKNAGFVNVKSGRLVNDGYGYRYVIANYLIGATIDNVYIATNEYVSATKEENPGWDIANSALLASSAIADTKISNSYFRLAKTATGASNVLDVMGGVLFSTTRIDESYTFNNVVVYSKDESYGLHRLTINDVTKTTKNEVITYSHSTVDIPLSAMLVKVATPQSIDENGKLTGKLTKGLIYLFENQNPANTTDYSVAAYEDENLAEVYDFAYLTGVSRYRTGSELKKGFASGSKYNNLEGFADSCWDETSGYPSWINK